MTVQFSAYSFIKREYGSWVALGCIKDDTVGDALQYNYTLPISADELSIKAEVGGIYQLATTARMVLPAGPETHIVWKVTSEDVKSIAVSDEEVLAALIQASTSFAFEIMEDNILEAAMKEINGESISEDSSS